VEALERIQVWIKTLYVPDTGIHNETIKMMKMSNKKATDTSFLKFLENVSDSLAQLVAKSVVNSVGQDTKLVKH
jgi:hypothetical protein